MATRGVAFTATFMALDSATGRPKTGDAANITARKSKDGTSSALTSGTVTEVDSTNLKGLYKVSLDATEADADEIVVGGVSSTSGIDIVPTTYQMERLPNAAPGANGGVPVLDSNLESKASTLRTNNDKTGYGLSSAAVQAIWDALTSALTTSGSIGKRLADDIDATISSRSTYAGGDTSGVTTLLARIGSALTITSGKVDISAAAVQAIWDALTSALTTSGSIGKRLADDIDVVLSTRLATSGYTAPLDAAGTRSAVGLASANLDTQLAAIAGYIDTEVAAIKAKTDGLPSDPADASDIAASFVKIRKYLQLLARKDAAIATDNATELGELNADGGSGAGVFANTTDAQEAIRDNMGTPQTGDSFARLGAPAGASVSADVASVQADTDNIQTRLPAALDANGFIKADVEDWKAATAPAMTGDAFARLGAPAGASIAADIAADKAVDDAIKAKTDNLPSDPADESLVIAATDAIYNRLGAPAGASVSADVAAVKADTGAIKTKTDNLPSDPADESLLEAAIAAIAPPSAADVADAVWEEAIADHSGTAGSTAEALGAAGAAGDPWSTALPGAYGAGSAGKILGDNLDAKSSDIKARTDLIPDEPADQPLVTAGFDALVDVIGTPAGASVSEDIANVKADSGPTAITVAANLDAKVSETGTAVELDLVKQAVQDIDSRIPADLTADGLMPSDMQAIDGNVPPAITKGVVLAGSTTTLVKATLTPPQTDPDQFAGLVLKFLKNTLTPGLQGQGTTVDVGGSGTDLPVTALTEAPAAGDEFTLS